MFYVYDYRWYSRRHENISHLLWVCMWKFLVYISRRKNCLRTNYASKLLHLSTLLRTPEKKYNILIIFWMLFSTNSIISLSLTNRLRWIMRPFGKPGVVSSIYRMDTSSITIKAKYSSYYDGSRRFSNYGQVS